MELEFLSLRGPCDDSFYMHFMKIPSMVLMVSIVLWSAVYFSRILSWTCYVMSESFTIQISGKLVDRLADDGERLKKKAKKTRSRIPREPQPSHSKVHEKQIFDDSETHKGPATGWPLQSPMFLPETPSAQYANAELDAVRSVRQESERVLGILQKKEENMVQEVTQRANDLRDKEFKLPYQKPVPCFVEKDACFTCYHAYFKDPLKCAHLVKDFADCVRRAKQEESSAET